MADAALTEHAEELLATNRYLTLGTVDGDGHPWTTPVYFAANGLREFLWMSEQTAEHSLNLAANPRVSLVVFDSTVPAYHGRALYAAAVADVVPDDELAAALEVYPGPVSRGGSALAVDDVTGGSPWRLYRARATELWALCPRDPGQPCPRHGEARDHRVRVDD